MIRSAVRRMLFGAATRQMCFVAWSGTRTLQFRVCVADEHIDRYQLRENVHHFLWKLCVFVRMSASPIFWRRRAIESASSSVRARAPWLEQIIVQDLQPVFLADNHLFRRRRYPRRAGRCGLADLRVQSADLAFIAFSERLLSLLVQLPLVPSGRPQLKARLRLARSCSEAGLRVGKALRSGADRILDFTTPGVSVSTAFIESPL